MTAPSEPILVLRVLPVRSTQTPRTRRSLPAAAEMDVLMARVDP